MGHSFETRLNVRARAEKFQSCVCDEGVHELATSIPTKNK